MSRSTLDQDLLADLKQLILINGVKLGINTLKNIVNTQRHQGKLHPTTIVKRSETRKIRYPAKIKEPKVDQKLKTRRKYISDKNFLNLISDIRKVKILIPVKTYKELSIKYNVTTGFIAKHFLVHRTNKNKNFFI